MEASGGLSPMGFMLELLGGCAGLRASMMHRSLRGARIEKKGDPSLAIRELSSKQDRLTHDHRSVVQPEV